MIFCIDCLHFKTYMFESGELNCKHKTCFTYKTVITPVSNAKRETRIKSHMELNKSNSCPHFKDREKIEKAEREKQEKYNRSFMGRFGEFCDFFSFDWF